MHFYRITDGQLETLAEEALEQIDSKRYDMQMKQEEINDILKFGIAFSGKRVIVKMGD